MTLAPPRKMCMTRRACRRREWGADACHPPHPPCSDFLNISPTLSGNDGRDGSGRPAGWTEEWTDEQTDGWTDGPTCICRYVFFGCPCWRFPPSAKDRCDQMKNFDRRTYTTQHETKRHETTPNETEPNGTKRNVTKRRDAERKTYVRKGGWTYVHTRVRKKVRPSVRLSVRPSVHIYIYKKQDNLLHFHYYKNVSCNF